MEFSEFILSQKHILLDGAMGTQLDKRGLMGWGQANLIAPEVVLEIHKQYVQSGCDALTTNTLTMNRIYIETHNVDVDVRDVNRAGVELARESAGTNLYVLGNISSTGQMLEPYGTYKEAEFYDAFKEQAEVLAEAGVDGFIIETMFDLREALCALHACKDNFSLPVLVSIAFATEKNGGRTIMGNFAQECAQKLSEAGADVIGTNCGDLDPFQMAKITATFKETTSLPILVQPNAGKPKLKNNQTVFDMAPEEFAEGIKECINAGAKIVGGCCGTTPSHIKAVANILDKRELA